MTLPVQTRGLVRMFGARAALDGVTLEVNEGEIFALLGPNGGGKTTLFRILSTLLRPTSGSASVCGHDVETASAAVRSSLGVVFQSPSLDDQLTVAENLRYGGNLYGLHGARLQKLLVEMAEALRVADRLGDRVKDLSGGLQRRVEIAKSLLPRPRVLLLDEPSTGLDPSARIDLWNILGQVRAKFGTTVVLTTHLMDEAERCDRVAILSHGKMIACGTPDTLRATVGGDVLVIEAKDPGALAGQLRERFGWNAVVQHGSVRVEIPHAHEEAVRAVGAFPGAIQLVRAGRPTLEDVFVHMTGERLEEEFFADVPTKGRKRKK